MKKLITLLLPALLLTACAKEPVPSPAPEQEWEPSVSEPEPAPVSEPEPAPVSEPPLDAPEPETAPVQDSEPAPEPEPETGTVVQASERSGDVEESTSYKIRVPVIEGAGDGAAAINAYYERVSDRLYDMAYGEIYEQSLAQSTTLNLIGDYAVTRNDGKVFSVRRSVTVYDMRPGTGEWNVGVQYSQYGETFDLETGGLLTPGEIFDADPQVYTERLVECVKRYIREHPNTGGNDAPAWVPEWEAMAAERFDAERFYLTGDAYVVWYEDGDVSLELMEIPIPWRQLADILKIEV